MDTTYFLQIAKAMLAFLGIIFVISLLLRGINAGARVGRAWVIFLTCYVAAFFLIKAYPSSVQTFLLTQGAWFVPAAGIILCVGLAWVFGREPQGRGTIIHEYNPPHGLLPGEMSFLLEQRVSHRLIVSTVLNLGQRGYLKLSMPTDEASADQKYAMALKKEKSPVDLQPYEKEVWKGIFRSGGTQASLPEAVKYLAGAHTSVETALTNAFVQRGLVPKHDRWPRVRWMVHGSLMLLITLYLLPGITSQAAFISMTVLIPAIFLMAWRMPNRTKLGSEYVEACLGFKRMLEVSEIARLASTDHPKLKPAVLSNLLPYAVALDIEHDWVEAIPYTNLGLLLPKRKVARSTR